MGEADELRAAAAISEEDKSSITRFVQFKIAEAAITSNRAEKLSRTLRLIGTRYLKGRTFQDLTREEIIGIIARLEHESEFSAWTRRDYKLILRMFLLWLGKDADWIKVTPPRSDVQPEEMLTPEEIAAMVDASNTLRDKALIACLYEGGFRVAELGTAQLKDVSFDDAGAVVIVRGKTGIRRVRLISSVPHLSAWLAAHPRRDDRKAPLWLDTQHGGILQYDALRMQLQKIAKRAGIQKKVNPHNFRHSRASFLASRLTESQLEQYLGWQHGSTMPRTYVHMSGRDIDQSLREMHGLPTEAKKDGPTVRLCPICKSINQVKAVVCQNCKRPLDMAAEDYISLEDRFAALQHEHERLRQEHETLKATKAADFAAFGRDLVAALGSDPELRAEFKKLIRKKKGEE